MHRTAAATRCMQKQKAHIANPTDKCKTKNKVHRHNDSKKAQADRGAYEVDFGHGGAGKVGVEVEDAVVDVGSSADQRLRNLQVA